MLGAYDEISVAGKFLRTYIMPFYSFTETNIKRYTRLFANIRHLKGSLPEKALAALKRLIYAAIMWASVTLWNNTVITSYSIHYTKLYDCSCFECCRYGSVIFIGKKVVFFKELF